MQLKKTFQLSRLALSCGIAMLAMNQSVQASGFAVPELNITGLALSNALVANPDSLAAIAYNPAAMSFHEGSSVAAGALLVKPDLSVDTGSGSVDSTANDVVGIPSLSAHSKLTETWSLGISVNAPFGLETEWPAGTFDAQYPLGSTIPTQSKLEIVAFSPSVAYKISENISFAGGVDYYWMREVIFNGVANAGSPGSNPVANLKGDGRGVGLNLGLMIDQGNWSFGGSYHSEANIPIEGTVDLPATALPAFFSNNVHADLKLPYRLQVGVRNQTTDKLAIEFDITRTGWSSFDKLIVDHDQYGVNIVTSDNNWDDANAYRLGATYDISQATQLRIGYTFDETPQDDAFFSPRIPDSDRQLFSFGLGHTLGNGWTIDAGYMYVKFDERTINSTTAAVAGQETNGTTAVNGTYDSSVHLLGLGVTKHFM
ncbi:MAG: porin [Candidatus Thiodiazotropha sp. (ex Myrtea sp. 'scaly one' KF741663)]|nr:porin [Candidatus Thiodiazotropha sp. (ex Myrtea sp. 'scaly one' KF741663)]